ncbi:hypothetical protein V6N13_122009 [Hibiscus sabdariffa]|uniref:Legume lectin domain-containing protein n=1 Tax=Hibiscus sabdariffa TaxID=183260 RepID=A0ABR2AD28_9ROSI
MFLGIEIDARKDEKVGDFNANHVGIDVGSLEPVEVCNLSSLNLVLNNGEPLKSWDIILAMFIYGDLGLVSRHTVFSVESQVSPEKFRYEKSM